MFIERRFYNAVVISQQLTGTGVFDYGHGIFAVDSVYDRREQTAIHPWSRMAAPQSSIPGPRTRCRA